MKILKKYNNKQGFTLVELLVVITIMGIVLAVIYSFFLSTNKFFVLGSNQNDSQNDARLGADAIMFQVRYATEANLVTKENAADSDENAIYIDNDNKLVFVKDGEITQTISGYFESLSFSKVTSDTLQINLLSSYGERSFPVSVELKLPNFTLLPASINGSSGEGLVFSSAAPVTPILGGGDIRVTGVELDSITLNKGQTMTLIAKVSPLNATNKTVTWESLNPSIAEIDGNGLVTAKEAGVTNIIVTTADGGKTATAQVTVSTVTSSPLKFTNSPGTRIKTGLQYIYIPQAEGGASPYLYSFTVTTIDDGTLKIDEQVVSQSSLPKTIIGSKLTWITTVNNKTIKFNVTVKDVNNNSASVQGVVEAKNNY